MILVRGNYSIINVDYLTRSSMEEELAGLKITEGEEEALQLYGDAGLQQQGFDLCLVGCFLTVVHFSAKRNILVNL